MHGCGNDFIIIDGRKTDVSGLLADTKRIATLSDRRFGIGCDQFIVIAKSDKADVEMVIRNSDGSVAGMCGNAARCVASLILDETGKGRITLSVGPRTLDCWRDGQVVVDMGAPANIGTASGFDGLPEALTVDMGNPHAVFVVDNADKIPLEIQGPRIENDPQFPDRTNVEFVSREGDGHLRMRVWERGAGITLACGSGACATIVAAVQAGISPRKAKIRMDGGSLELEWRESDGHVLMAGPVTHVFTGSLPDL